MSKISIFLTLIMAMIMACSPMNGEITGTAQSNVQDPDDVFLPVVRNGVFIERFTGAPSQPQPWRSDNWDISIHSRDVNTWENLDAMHAAHGPDCSPPPDTHPVSAYADSVFLCRDHVMTAINGKGYGAIYLTPNQMVDFSQGEAIIRFDVSTLRTSLRDWIDVWISPYDDHLQLPLKDWLPDLSGEPRRAILLEMGNFNGKTTFELYRVNNFALDGIDGMSWMGYEEFLTPSAARRDTFELRISKTHIKFGMPDYDVWWYDTDIPALDWSKGVVQFGHHSYTPEKECSGCGANTWHWDNVQITPAEPFSIIPAKQRYTDEQAGARIDLAKPVPADAYLRFAGIGKALEVSFNGGKTWTLATTKAQERYVEENFWSYWMPIPPGTQQVTFRGEKWWGGDWRVRDVSAWSTAGPNE